MLEGLALGPHLGSWCRVWEHGWGVCQRPPLCTCCSDAGVWGWQNFFLPSGLTPAGEVLWSESATWWVALWTVMGQQKPPLPGWARTTGTSETFPVAAKILLGRAGFFRDRQPSLSSAPQLGWGRAQLQAGGCPGHSSCPGSEDSCPASPALKLGEVLELKSACDLRAGPQPTGPSSPALLGGEQGAGLAWGHGDTAQRSHGAWHRAASRLERAEVMCAEEVLGSFLHGGHIQAASGNRVTVRRWGLPAPSQLTVRATLTLPGESSIGCVQTPGARQAGDSQ